MTIDAIGDGKDGSAKRPASGFARRWPTDGRKRRGWAALLAWFWPDQLGENGLAGEGSDAQGGRRARRAGVLAALWPSTLGDEYLGRKDAAAWLSGRRGRRGALAALWPSTLGEEHLDRGRARKIGLFTALWPTWLSGGYRPGADGALDGKTKEFCEAEAWRARRRKGVALAMLATAVLAPDFIAGQSGAWGGRIELFHGGAAGGGGQGGGQGSGGAGGGSGGGTGAGPSLPNDLQPGGPPKDEGVTPIVETGGGPDSEGGEGPTLAGGEDPPGLTFFDLGPSPEDVGPIFLGGGGGGGPGGGGPGGGGPGGGGFPPGGGDPTDPPGAGDPAKGDPPFFDPPPTFQDPPGGGDGPGPGGPGFEIPGGGNHPSAPGAVPEPATWAMMILGFGAIGYVLRRRRITVTG